MNLTYILYNDINKDGRARELTKFLSKETNLTLVTICSNPKEIKNEINLISSQSKNTFYNLFFFWFNIFKQIRQTDVFYIDNRKAVFICFFIYPLIKKKILVQDMREFYTLKDKRSYYSNIGTLIEGFFATNVNFLITANNPRARLTKKMYGLKRQPLVYENRRSFPEISRNNKKIIKSKYFDLLSNSNISINNDKINLISTSGFTSERGCIEVVKGALSNIKNVNLYLIGKTSKKDLMYLKSFLSENHNSCNIFLLDSITLSELKELLKIMDVGIVNYSLKNRNNIYCASGKVYEFLSLNIPVLTTENYSLKDFINNNRFGISNNDFKKSIKKMTEEISFYKQKTSNFSSVDQIYNYNKNFVKSLIFKIENSENEKKH